MMSLSKDLDCCHLKTKITLSFATIFIILALIVITQGSLACDGWISSHISSLYSDTLTKVMKIISDINAMRESLALSFVFVLWLVYKKWYKEAKIYTTSLFLSIFAFASLKHLIARARPESILANAHNYSFPSGHSTMSMAMALGVYFVFADKTQKRTLLLVGTILWAILVGFSRIYLNVHWCSDVLAGWSLGVVCAVVAQTILSKI
jgi:undecaprenyl-diphosphatase